MIREARNHAANDASLVATIVYGGDDGGSAVLEVSASNLIAAASAEKWKPVWLVALVLKTGKEWRC